MLCVRWVNNSGVSNDNTSLLRLHRSIAPQKQHGAKSMWNIDARMKHCSVSSVDLDNALVRKRLRSSHLLVPWKVGKNYWLSGMCHVKKPWLIDWLIDVPCTQFTQDCRRRKICEVWTHFGVTVQFTPPHETRQFCRQCELSSRWLKIFIRQNKNKYRKLT